VANTINCPVCGKLTDSRLDSCPHCGAYLKSRRQQHKAQQAARTTKTCPRCGSGVQEGDLICVSCGTNLLTGHKIVDEAASRKRRSMPRGLIAGVSGVTTIVLAVVALWFFVATSDPLRQAERLAADGRTLEAMDILAEYVQNVPDDAPALLQLGRLQWMNNRRSDAAATFARASRLAPSNADAAMSAAIASASTNPGATPDFIDVLQRAADLNPSDPGLWYVLGLAHGVNGDYAGEVGALERTLNLRPTDDSAKLSLGIAQALNGDASSARSVLQAVGDGERKADAIAATGFVAALNGDATTAERRLNDALGREGLTLSGSAGVTLGRMKLLSGAYGEAQGYLDQALASDPNNRLALYLRGLCLQARGRFQDALTDFERLTSEPGPYAGEAGVQAADVHLAMNAPDRARRALDDASRAGSRSAAYYSVAGRLALASGDPEGALIQFDTAIRTDPNYASAYLERALIHIQRDDIAPGLADLEKYLKTAGEGAPGSRIAEVRALAEQLRQAAGGSEARQAEARI